MTGMSFIKRSWPRGAHAPRVLAMAPPHRELGIHAGGRKLRLQRQCAFRPSFLALYSDIPWLISKSLLRIVEESLELRTTLGHPSPNAQLACAVDRIL